MKAQMSLRVLGATVALFGSVLADSKKAFDESTDLPAEAANATQYARSLSTRRRVAECCLMSRKKDISVAVRII
jgi:hypothetical protein